MYRIVDWDERYEVDTKGRDWKPGAPKWSGPLRFIRLKVNGAKLGRGYRRLQKIAQIDAFQTFGIFCKLLELAGDSDRDGRNLIPDAEELAEILDGPLDQIQKGLTNLLAVGWIEELPNVRKLSESSAQHNITEHNKTKRKRFHMESVGDSNGQADPEPQNEYERALWRIRHGSVLGAGQPPRRGGGTGLDGDAAEGDPGSRGDTTERDVPDRVEASAALADDHAAGPG
ncbi:MAG: hypothetical protein WC907_01030 [Acholeplasmataceae bacterium]|jgi:hypothetical protein